MPSTFRSCPLEEEPAASLEDAMRALGHAVARLDSGPRRFGAEHLYRSAGSEPVGSSNANPVATFSGEKVL